MTLTPEDLEKIAAIVATSEARLAKDFGDDVNRLLDNIEQVGVRVTGLTTEVTRLGEYIQTDRRLNDHARNRFTLDLEKLEERVDKLEPKQ